MIFPSEFPSHRIEYTGEKEVYDALKKLPDEFAIFYHVKLWLQNSRGGKQECELDFLVCDLREGKFNAMMVIEAKSGHFRYVADTKEWFQGSNNQNDLIDKLTANTHLFIGQFKNLLAPVPVSWAFWFSTAQNVNKQWYPQAILPWQVIDYMGSLHPLEYITNSLDGLRNAMPDRQGAPLENFNKLKSTLLRGANFIETLRSRFDLNDQKFLTLTEDQITKYKELLDNKRILTRGCAGSGKTIIARKLAEDLAGEEQKVLFLCFNRRLADTLQQALRANADKITVNTFHSFAEGCIRKTDPDWWDREFEEFSKIKGKTDFFEYAVGLKFQESISIIQGTYDALIMDEAQDLKQDWLLALYSLVKPEGRISIFLDEEQNLFQRFSGIPEDNTFVKQRLTENCRNTRKIHDYIVQKTGIASKSKTGLPEGVGVKELTYNNFEELGSRLREELHALLHKGNLLSNEIMIMINGFDKELQQLHEASAPEIKIAALQRDTVQDNNTIYFTSVKSFKGLESPALILINPEQPVDTKSKARFYAQASRAKNFLLVIKGVKYSNQN